MKYIVATADGFDNPVDNKRYSEGDEVLLSPKLAAPLIEQGVLKPTQSKLTRNRRTDD